MGHHYFFKDTNFNSVNAGVDNVKHIDEPHAIQLDNLEKFIENIKELKKAIGSKTKIKMKANIK